MTALGLEARTARFGAMQALGRDAVGLFTDWEVDVERWPREWPHKFQRAFSERIQSAKGGACLERPPLR
jgi:hypothetical protein